MLFLEAPPDTARYMVAGYVIAVLVMFGYAISLYLRERRLQRDLDDLEDLAAEEKRAA
jgi:hypothetical protein